MKKYKDKPVVVYCENGFASATAARALNALGFTKVVTLRGGLQSWRQENLPLVKADGKKAKSWQLAGCRHVLHDVVQLCRRARGLLERKGVGVREIKVDEDPSQREVMVQKSGRRTVPQIFIGERHVGGYDLAALERAGELDKLAAPVS